MVEDSIRLILVYIIIILVAYSGYHMVIALQTNNVDNYRKSLFSIFIGGFLLFLGMILLGETNWLLS
jgi:hypothetical protein